MKNFSTFILCILISAPSVLVAFDAEDLTGCFSQPEIHGFIENRSGFRLQNDPHEKDISVMDIRMQLECSTYTDWFDIKYKGDVWGDFITETAEYDTREAWIFIRPTDYMDIKIGRQILTWGTGDWVFLNDLFPKDWQSFFIGRDSEYLKAPSDAAKVSLFRLFVTLTSFTHRNLIRIDSSPEIMFLIGMEMKEVVRTR